MAQVEQEDSAPPRHSALKHQQHLVVYLGVELTLVLMYLERTHPLRLVRLPIQALVVFVSITNRSQITELSMFCNNYFFVFESNFLKKIMYM